MKRFFMAFLIFSTYATALQAEDLAGRQEALVHSHARVSELNELHGRYQKMRDSLVHHEKGLVGAQKEMAEKSAAWLNEWKKILNVVGLVDDLSIVNAAQLAGRIEQLFSAQRQAYDDIVRAAGLVNQKGQLLRSQVNMVSVSPLNRYPADERPYVELMQGAVALYGNASDEAISGAYVLLAKLYSIFEPTRRKFELNLSAALIASGRIPLLEAIAAAAASLRADEIATPFVVGMREHYERFRGVRARELFFLAEAKARDAENYAVEAKQTIENARLDSGIASDALQYIESYRIRVREEFKILTTQGEAKTVANGARKMRALFKNRCVAADPAVNCERLRDMARISEDQIFAMSSQERRAFEALWDKVGPILP